MEKHISPKKVLNLKILLIEFLLFDLSTMQMQYMPGSFLADQFLSAVTAYGPGINVFTPWTYVDLAYDNIPFIGKFPVLGKDGTSSYAIMSPQQLKEGNPMPPIYLAKPLPPHVPEPVEVVAVPLDEEALHGEPLFPKELPLPWAKTKQTNKERDENTGDSLKNPFTSSEMNLSEEEGSKRRQINRKQFFYFK